MPNFEERRTIERSPLRAALAAGVNEGATESAVTAELDSAGVTDPTLRSAVLTAAKRVAVATRDRGHLVGHQIADRETLALEQRRRDADLLLGGDAAGDGGTGTAGVSREEARDIAERIASGGVAGRVGRR